MEIKAVPGRLRILSLNCNGVPNKLPVIWDLCQNADILLLQETWLLPADVGLLDSVHSDFSSFSLSAVDDRELLVGRPYGGLSFMWRKSLAPALKIVTFDDERLLGISVKSTERVVYSQCVLSM